MTMNQVFERLKANVLNDEYAQMRLSYAMEDGMGEISNPALTTWEVKLIANTCSEELEDGKDILIASARIHAVESTRHDPTEAFIAMDEHSHEMLGLAEGTVQKWDGYSRIFAIELVTVEPEFRGNGIAPMLVASALNRLGGGTPYVAVLEIGCMGWENMTKTALGKVLSKTAATWRRAGFKRVNGRGDNYCYAYSRDVTVRGTQTSVLERLRMKDVKTRQTEVLATH